MNVVLTDAIQNDGVSMACAKNIKKNTSHVWCYRYIMGKKCKEKFQNPTWRKNELSKKNSEDSNLNDSPETENSMNVSDSETDTSAEEETGSRFQEYFNELTEDIIPKMTETLLTFYDLKNIDEELTEIDEEKGDLPEKIDSLKDKIKITEKEMNEKKNSTDKLETEKSKLMEDNASYEDRINKYDEQKYEVRSNDEYDGNRYCH